VLDKKTVSFEVPPAMNSGRKVAIVTGASQGIGAALVRAFRDRDYGVVANSRSIEPTQDENVRTVAGDISKRETALAIVDEAIRGFGRIDCLVNNAGIFLAKPFTEYTEDDLRDVLATNVAGFFHVTQASIARMVDQAVGHVVNITATLADHPSSKLPAVLTSVTKGGLNSATKALAIEYASYGIRVNAVSPGATQTRMQPVQPHQTLREPSPLGRMGDVSDIVGAVLYLESAPFVTGEILHVDGGESAGN
jgi:NAD(P)-dependent dehydrogenase (short-subunit alcohol dehydrogenase family)